MPVRRRLAYVAASVIAAAGMMTGRWLAGGARAAGEESQLAPILGILSWVAAGIAAVLIDRTVPARGVGLASLALPLVWFAMLLAGRDNSLWLLGLAALALFALLAAASAVVTKACLRIARSKNI